MPNIQEKNLAFFLWLIQTNKENLIKQKPKQLHVHSSAEKINHGDKLQTDRKWQYIPTSKKKTKNKNYYFHISCVSTIAC